MRLVLKDNTCDALGMVNSALLCAAQIYRCTKLAIIRLEVNTLEEREWNDALCEHWDKLVLCIDARVRLKDGDTPDKEEFAEVRVELLRTHNCGARINRDSYVDVFWNTGQKLRIMGFGDNSSPYIDTRS